MIFNKILSAVTAVALTASSAVAKIDGGTVDLINTVDASDIHVTIDGTFCTENPGYSGVYMHSGFRRQLHLCPGADVDANDHDTVRHEVFHAIQHCVNAARGTHLDTPINQDIQEVNQAAHDILGADYVRWIQSSYERKDWLIEYEANIGARIFTASDLQDMFKRACLN